MASITRRIDRQQYDQSVRKERFAVSQSDLQLAHIPEITPGYMVLPRSCKIVIEHRTNRVAVT
jgi:hypothetical protein